jgi:hypothetical protein
MQSFANVIKLWPSDADFASDIKVKPNHLAAMKCRGSIPSRYWLDIVRGATTREIPNVTMTRLARIAKAKTSKRSE